MKKIIFAVATALVFTAAFGAANVYDTGKTAKKATKTESCACHDCTCKDCNCTDCSKGSCNDGCCKSGSHCSNGCCKK